MNPAEPELLKSIIRRVMKRLFKIKRHGGCPLDRKREASTLSTRHAPVGAEIYGESTS